MDDRLRFVIRSRDHPRIRGTNFGTILIVSESVGSPPHTRDKYNREAYGAEKGGITPAYAGQMLFLDTSAAFAWDHPRIRGTNFFTRLDWLPEPGSSPHTRDKFVTKKMKQVHRGIIPAYAGQILFTELRKVEKRDHPRIRGTNSNQWNNDFAIPGSSPHTRDK